MIIRAELTEDHAAIRSITTSAFAPMPYSSGTEAAIIDALRSAEALQISLVAVEDDEIIGHVAFSRVSINEQDLGWFGPGPVAVKPGHQKQGIGSALIETGLKELRAFHAQGCILLGDPGYYSRFGFVCDPRLTYGGAPPKFFIVLAFTDRIPEGEVKFHPGFDAS